MSRSRRGSRLTLGTAGTLSMNFSFVLSGKVIPAGGGGQACEGHQPQDPPVQGGGGGGGVYRRQQTGEGGFSPSIPLTAVVWRQHIFLEARPGNDDTTGTWGTEGRLRTGSDAPGWRRGVRERPRFPGAAPAALGRTQHPPLRIPTPPPPPGSQHSPTATTADPGVPDPNASRLTREGTRVSRCQSLPSPVRPPAGLVGHTHTHAPPRPPPKAASGPSERCPGSPHLLRPAAAAGAAIATSRPGRKCLSGAAIRSALSEQPGGEHFR